MQDDDLGELIARQFVRQASGMKDALSLLDAYDLSSPSRDQARSSGWTSLAVQLLMVR